MTNTTLITALFDIGREKNGDGRTIDEYLKWFDKTLSLNVPMVIFIQEKFKDFVLSRRNLNQTKIIIQPLNKIPYYNFKQNIEKIIFSDEYKHKIKDPSRIECNLSLYNIIQYSKFDWLEIAADNNYFNTDNYFWMDAGCSRFFDGVDTKNAWPTNSKLICDNKMTIQGNVNTKKYYNNWPGNDEYIWDNNCILVGTLFGGNKTICKKMNSLVKNLFEEYLKKNCVNNEQIILGILLKQYPELFNVYIELNGKHLPLFKALC